MGVILNRILYFICDFHKILCSVSQLADSLILKENPIHAQEDIKWQIKLHDLFFWSSALIFINSSGK